MTSRWVTPALIGLVAFAIALAEAARADLYPVPVFPLTDSERLAYTVSDAEAIAFGEVLGVGDSLEKEANGSGFIQNRSVVFRPANWLKGSGPKDAMKIGISAKGQAGPHVFNELGHNKRHALVFLRRVPAPMTSLPAGVPWPHPPSRRWRLSADPSEYDQGIAFVESDGPLLSRVKDIIRSQEPKALARQSDIVLLGNILETPSTAEISGKLVSCPVVQRVQAFVGSPPEEFKLFVPYGEVRPGENVLLLKRLADDVFTAHAFSSSVALVKDEYIPRLGMTLEQFERAVTQGRPARVDGGDK